MLSRAMAFCQLKRFSSSFLPYDIFRGGARRELSRLLLPVAFTPDMKEEAYEDLPTEPRRRGGVEYFEAKYGMRPVRTVHKPFYRLHLSGKVHRTPLVLSS